MILRSFTLFIAFAIFLASPEAPALSASDAATVLQLAQANNAASRNHNAGKAFLSANRMKVGVKMLPSGLQYLIIRPGTGQRPKATDEVVVHYRGTSIDGKEFDSSYARGQPATFPVNRVIAGWTDALQAMRTGAKWKVAIPPELAYGQRGAGSVIGPNETLLFDIELLAIK
ncbi:MAG: FKBP-type peptidyl-prolyl cis-trans isomerase [Pseudomonadota bacterium]|nr:FKBP-type peptidyl-prolyl cis-trans isomerase [Pseudomonadota bacterium]